MGLFRVLREIISLHDLLFILIDKELRSRYKQSALGPLWAVIRPLLLMCLFIMLQVITGIKTTGAPYPVLVYTALLPWTFLASSVTIATDSMISNASIIKKLYCPRYVFPLVAIGTCLIDLFIAMFPLLFMLLYYRLSVSINILYLPLLIAIQFVFMTGVSLITSSVTVYKRDVLIIMPFMMQFWMFASPVMYPLQSVPERWKAIYNFNPMVGIIESYRNIILFNKPPYFSLLLLDTVIAAAFLVIGITIYRRLERNFADVI